MSEETIQKYFNKVDSLKGDFISRLAEAVAIESVSAEPERRPKVTEMAHWLVSQLKTLGATDIQLKDLGIQEGTKDLPLPPIVVARYGTDPAKKNILIYGHYDVQPANLEDGWNTEPFKLVEKGDALYGRGSTDDKGPVVCWLNMLQAHNELGLDIPVNIVFCFEGMEESGSLGLEGLIEAEKDKYFKGVDAVCISDNYWLGTTHPVLTYGVRGCNYYSITIEGPASDLHSGLFGGVVNEPMIDVSHIFSKLVTPQGEILIPGIQEMVAPLTPEEDKLYDAINFDVKGLEGNIGSQTLIHDNIKSALQARWRNPSLSIHGVEGAFYGAGAKTVIPAKIVGKFSIRTVPDIESAKLDKIVIDYVHEIFKSLGSKNTCKAELIHDGMYWVSNPHNWSFRAAAKATKAVWGVEPDYTREGGSIPITLSFQDILKTSVILLPVGRGDDGAHSTNEKINVSNYIEGVKTLGSYLHYLSQEEKDA